MESSGALGGALFDEVAIEEDVRLLSAGHEEMDLLGDFRLSM